MRPRAVIAVVFLVAFPAEAGRDKPAPKSQRAFDHDAHALAMKNAGRGTEGCAGRCHRVEIDGDWVETGKKEHARCFAACHTFETSCSSLAQGPGKVCLTCHVNLKARCVPNGFLPAMGDDFSSRYSHKKHIAGQTTSQQCEGCHGAFGKTESPKKRATNTSGHQQCQTCHDRSHEPRMTQCTGCHVDPTTIAKHPRQQNPYAVAGAFNHIAHARVDRVGTSGKNCLACHQNIANATDEFSVPLPTMQGCYQSCHNGKTAFSAVGATCTRCHQGGRK